MHDILWTEFCLCHYSHLQTSVFASNCNIYFRYKLNVTWWLTWKHRPCLNEYHLSVYCYSDYKHKTILRPSYHHNSKPSSGKRAYLYWEGPPGYGPPLVQVTTAPELMLMHCQLTPQEQPSVKIYFEYSQLNLENSVKMIYIKYCSLRFSFHWSRTISQWVHIQTLSVSWTETHFKTVGLKSQSGTGELIFSEYTDVYPANIFCILIRVASK